MWQWLASPEPDLPTTASGSLPDGVLLDCPPPQQPDQLFRLDPAVFRNTLVQLPAARSPWLREILDNLSQPMYARFF